MAIHCPNKKQQMSQARTPPRGNKGQFKKNRKSRPRSSFARATVQEADSNDEDIELSESDDDKDENELNILHIAARIAKFTTEQHEEWAKEMRDRGVDFQ
jgi:hypothetical protein